VKKNHRLSIRTLLIWGATLLAGTTAIANTVVQGKLTSVQVISSGTSSAVAVHGNFTPATGCGSDDFVLVSADSYFSQSYAVLLTALATGATVQIVFVDCSGTDARAAGYTVLSN
jgi:hypothetical protein